MIYLDSLQRNTSGIETYRMKLCFTLRLLSLILLTPDGNSSHDCLMDIKMRATFRIMTVFLVFFLTSSLPGDQCFAEIYKYQDENGKVQDPKVVKAEPEGVFEEAALAAIVKYKFIPATIGKKNVKCIAVMPIGFEIK